MEQKFIYIVLTRSSTILSNIIHFVKQDEYTHAAIALDENLEYMFSFGRRYQNNPFIGCFRREQLDEGLYGMHDRLPGRIIRLEVTAEQYQEAVAIIEDFLLNNHRYEYNYIGLFSHLFRTGIGSPNRFFCSEFVYHVLYQAGICNFGIPRALVTPQSLKELDGEVVYEGNLKLYDRKTRLVEAGAQEVTLDFLPR